MKLSSTILTGIIALGVISCGEETPKERVNNISQETNELVGNSIGKIYEIVEDESFIKWTGSKPTEDHFGTLNIISSSIELKGKLIMGGDINIDMFSLKVTDIEDEESNAKLLGHLKGEDFFAVDQYPIAHLFVTESVMNDTARLLLAELEIKGIVHPAEIRYDIKNNDDIAVITGTHTFDRTMYDIKYKSKSIFGDLGDKFINDEIKLEFNIVLKEAKMN